MTEQTSVPTEHTRPEIVHTVKDGMDLVSIAGSDWPQLRVRDGWRAAEFLSPESARERAVVMEVLVPDCGWREMTHYTYAQFKTGEQSNVIGFSGGNPAIKKERLEMIERAKHQALDMLQSASW